ncbi:hypothetical protein J6Q66_08535 [bacterium]|nr:hypothetical protein [bacterium]
MTRIKGNNVNLGNSFVVRCDEDFAAENEWKKQRSVIIEKANQEAQEILMQAKMQAQQIVDNAVVEAQNQSDEIKENAKNEGYQAGYDNGYIDGTNQITQELTDKIVNVDNFTQSVFEIKKRIIKSAHKDIIELLAIISDKVCHKKLEQDEKIFEEITKSAINLLKEKENINIIVNPKMAQKMWEISDTFKETIQGLKNIKIIEDSSVGVDGTIVEGVKNRIDCTIQNQIKVIIDELYRELNFTSEEKLVEEVEDD